MQPPDESSAMGRKNLQRVSDALADAVPIDWHAEIAAHPELREQLTNLQRLESIRTSFSGSMDSSTGPGKNHTVDFPTTWGHLEVKRLVGAGAFAEVFLAYDSRLDSFVALKLLRRDRIRSDRARFLREAKRLAQVQHANVVTVHGVDEHEGRPGMWMQFLQGQNLEQRLDEQGTLSWQEAATIGAQLCQALAAIHAIDLFHGDLKTANVVRIADSGLNVLMDFGASSEVSASGCGQSSTCGTPLVMAPEVFLGTGPQSRAGDIYSLGVLLYRIVSGRYPVEADRPEDLRTKHRHREAVPLRDRRADLPARFIQTVERALAYDPGQRYPSAGDMERALLATLVDAAETHDLVAWWRQPAGVISSWFRHYRWRLIPALAAAALGIWLLMFFENRIRLDLYRFHAGRTQRIETRDRPVFAPGDSIYMKFQTGHDMYVYVLNESVTSPCEVVALFPLEYMDRGNPLPGDTAHLLPGTLRGKVAYWQMDEMGGQERMLIVVSRQPLAKVEAVVQEAARRRQAREPEGLTQAPIQGSREMNPPAPPPCSSELDKILRSLGGTRTRTLWWEVIELECPPIAASNGRGTAAASLASAPAVAAPASTKGSDAPQ
ncbi:MAG TPA: serine/threonine-protein kinase [Candidatus Krumholzibacteria bacterium]|nr:serine/threonine-protein kinase [Candidatus Krumholzibacteria bacterium]